MSEDFQLLQDGPEQWAPIPDFPLYEASSHGRIRSWNGRNRGGFKPRTEPHILRPGMASNGYLMVRLTGRSGSFSKSVHQLVLEAFAGPKPPEWQVRHVSGVKTDNRLSNLAYGSAQENSDDKYRHGTIPCGERNGLAKLTAEKVMEARKLRAEGAKFTELCALYGVSHATIRHAVVGDTWSHLPGAVPGRKYRTKLKLVSA